MKGETGAIINSILLVIESFIAGFYIYFFFSRDYSLYENKTFMERIGQNLGSKSFKSDYMKEFEKAFPYIDEEKGLVGNNWFSKTLDLCIIPIFILNFAGGANFNLIFSQLVNLKTSLLCLFISLILMMISFINTFFYVDHVNVADKDIYIFEFSFNSKIKERLEMIKLAKVIYIAGDLFLFVIVCVHLIFTLILHSDAREKENEFLINSSNQAKKAQNLVPINEL